MTKMLNFPHIVLRCSGTAIKKTGDVLESWTDCVWVEMECPVSNSLMYLILDWCPCDCPRDPYPCSGRRSPPPCPGPHDHRRQASALEGSKQYDFGRGSFGLEQQYLMFLQPAQRLLAGVLQCPQLELVCTSMCVWVYHLLLQSAMSASPSTSMSCGLLRGDLISRFPTDPNHGQLS